MNEKKWSGGGRFILISMKFCFRGASSINLKSLIKTRLVLSFAYLSDSGNRSNLCGIQSHPRSLGPRIPLTDAFQSGSSVVGKSHF